METDGNLYLLVRPENHFSSPFCADSFMIITVPVSSDLHRSLSTYHKLKVHIQYLTMQVVLAGRQ